MWKGNIARQWPVERLLLRPRDIRLAHLLFLLGPSSELELRRLHGAGVGRSLTALSDAGLTRLQGGLWKTRSVSSIFAVQQILSFEAKMNSWSDVLAQAAVNRWFASRSFALLPKLPTSSRFLNVAAELGVGVWLRGKSRAVQAPIESARQPLSYASWLFNEWAWRASRSECRTEYEGTPTHDA
jgi:hypothetical protein